MYQQLHKRAELGTENTPGNKPKALPQDPGSSLPVCVGARVCARGQVWKGDHAAGVFSGRRGTRLIKCMQCGLVSGQGRGPCLLLPKLKVKGTTTCTKQDRGERTPTPPQTEGERQVLPRTFYSVM